MGVLLFQPYPFFEGTTVSMTNNYDGISFDFQLNYILVFLGFSKLFIILRVVLTNTVYMSPRCKDHIIQPVASVECMGASAIICMLSSVYSRIRRWFWLELSSSAPFLYLRFPFESPKEMYHSFLLTWMQQVKALTQRQLTIYRPLRMPSGWPSSPWRLLAMAISIQEPSLAGLLTWYWSFGAPSSYHWWWSFSPTLSTWTKAKKEHWSSLTDYRPKSHWKRLQHFW